MTARERLQRTYHVFFGSRGRLTPAQELVIPHVLDGEDVLCVAPTGGGKTEAAVAPALELALARRRLPHVLYIAPTKALVNDLQKRLAEPVRKLGHRLGVQHGERKTVRGATVPILILTTPESLEVMLASSDTTLRESLRTIGIVIVDEVHEYQGTRRGVQLSLLLSRLDCSTGEHVQRVGLSATVANPEALARQVFGKKANVRIVAVDAQRSLRTSISVVGGGGDGHAAGLAEWVDDIVSKHDKVLLFANTRAACDWVFWQLDRASRVPVFLHYSSLDRQYRLAVEKRFAEARRAVCVATSTLELGIDIGDVGAVAMWGPPPTVSSFLQRVGRGNRRSAVQFVYCACRETAPEAPLSSAEVDSLFFAALVWAVQAGRMEAERFVTFYSVVLQQLLALCVKYGKVAPEAFLASVQDVPKFIDVRVLRTILDTLVGHGILEYDPSRRIWLPTGKFRVLVARGLAWSNFSSEEALAVEDDRGGARERLMELPKGFGKTLRAGEVVVLAGKPRVVLASGPHGVRVRELEVAHASMARFLGAGELVPKVLAECLRDVLRNGLRALDHSRVALDEDVSASIERAATDLGSELAERDHTLRFDGSAVVLYTFGGTLDNQLLADFLHAKTGVLAEPDAWRVLVGRRADFVKALSQASAKELRRLVSQRWDAYTKRFPLPPLFRYLPAELQHEELVSVLDPEGAAHWMREVADSLKE